ncbi:hypothetical protein A2U01_0055172, partial [Trifolium medium]|nr:hypothetical protein [Trifolium medium]
MAQGQAKKAQSIESDPASIQEKIFFQGRSVQSPSQLVEALKSDGAIPLSHGVFPQSQS